MEKEGQNYFLNLLKAARLERSLINLSFVLLAVGLANKINLDIFILMIGFVLIYAVGGIFNAKVDNDFKLKYATFTITILIFSALILSLHNKIIFFSFLISIFFAFLYSKSSRKILFGDSVILSITHLVIPFVSAALILNLEIESTILLATFIAIPFILIVPVKNLVGAKEDKKRGYKTLMTKYKNGKEITNILLGIYFLQIFLIYFIFNLSNKFLFIIWGIFAVKIFMDYYMNTGKEVEAYYIGRLIVILFAFAFVYDKASDIRLILLSSSFVLIYLTYFLFKLNGVKNGVL